jgi:hypothetical protein
MRGLAICILLPVVSLSVVANDSDTTSAAKKQHKMEHDICINTTFFIKQIVNFSGTSLAISPYIIAYNLFPVKNHGLRVGIGGNYSSQTQNPDSSFVQVNKRSEFDYRVGYEYRHFFGKTWVFYTGVDMVNSFTSVSSKVNSFSDIVTTSTNSWSLGGGPIAGIQVNITRHITLFTETAFYYSYSSSKSSTNSLNFPEENVNKVSAFGSSAAFVLPTSIYFVFRF